MTGAFVCFIDSYLLFSLFGLSNCLRIRGYLIKYPRIFHHVSMDISLRIHGYAKFLLCPRDLLVVCFWGFSYWWLVFVSRRLRRLSQISFFAECFFIFHTESTGNHRLWCIASLAPAIRDVCTRLGRQTVPLFIEGRAEQREAEGVTSVARRETSFTWGILRAPFFNSAWNSLRSVRSALCTRPSINRGTVFLITSIVTILFS